MDVKSIANSNVLFLLCALVVLFVSFQAIVFIKKALKEAKRINMDKKVIKRVLISSAVFSIIPSLPILIVYLVLLPSLGQYFPWLRLSVVGSGVYENMAADVGAKAFGLFGVNDPSLSPEVFVSILFVMSIGIIWSPLYAALGSKFILKGVQVIKGKYEKHFNLIFASMFLAMLATFCGPYLASIVGFIEPLSFKDALIKAIPFFVFCISAFSIVFLEKLAKILNSNAIIEFSFPLALVIGMGFAIFLTQIIG